MSKKEVIDCIMDIYNSRGRVNKNSIYEYSKKINKPLFQRCIEYFGNINNMYDELNINIGKNEYNIENKIDIDIKYIVDNIDSLYEKYGYITLRLLKNKIKDFDIFYRCKVLDIKIQDLLKNNSYSPRRVYGNNVFKKEDKKEFINKKDVNKEIMMCYNEFFNFSELILDRFNPYIIKNGVNKYYYNFKNMVKELNLIVNFEEKVDKIYLEKKLYDVFLIAKNNNKKISKSMFNNLTNIPNGIINKKYGSFDNFIKQNNDVYNYNCSFDITKKDVDNEIISIYEKSIIENKKFNIRYYHKYSKYSWFLERKIYNGFQDAVSKLGLCNNIIEDCDIEDIKKEMIRIYKEYNFFSVELFRQKNIYRNKATRFVYENIDGNFTSLSSELGIKLNKVTSTAYLLIITLEKILNEKSVLEISFNWLRNRNNNKYRIDAYFEKYNLIVEYNGKQHYEWVKLFHKTEEEFITYQNDYNDKIKQLKDNGFKILEWNYKDTIDDEIIIYKLKQLKII